MGSVVIAAADVFGRDRRERQQGPHRRHCQQAADIALTQWHAASALADTTGRTPAFG